MIVKELKKILEKADENSLVVLKVIDDRRVVSANAWVDDRGILVIEEDT